MKKLISLTTLILTITSSLVISPKTANSSVNNFNNQSTITTENEHLTNESLEQQAQQLYETGKLTEAITLLKQAISNYEDDGKINQQILAWRNLALVYQKLGDWQQGNDAISHSINLVSQLVDSTEKQQLLAQILEVKGQIQLSIGQNQEALDTWKKATNIYQKINDSRGFISGKINQSQALQALGLYYQAQKILLETNTFLEQQPDSLIKVKSLQSLGDVLRGVGELKESQKNLDQALTIAQKIGDPTAITETLISLGKTVRLQKQQENALDYFQQAEKIAPSYDLLIQSQLNQLELFSLQNQRNEVNNLISKIENSLTKLPPNCTAIYGRISLGKILINQLENNDNFSQNIAQILADAIKLSQNIGSQRSESEARGLLGNLYEKNQQYSEAKELTQKALILAQSINAPDLAYQWQWQLGRILKIQGDRKGAITYYTQSVNNLKSLRSDLVAISSEIQFSFKESVEPVYRELVSLLLEENSNQEQLEQARQVIESLQLAELDNFFRDACLDTKPVKIDELDQTAAIFYTIILPDRLEVIVKLPQQSLKHYSTKLPQSEIENTLQQLRATIAIPGERYRNKDRLKLSQTVYNWLLKPIEMELENSKIQNLVFISDGLLRNIPLAALYDGEKYLIQKYAIALTPGLELIDPQPLVQQQKRDLLGSGITEARPGFSPLPNVRLELTEIQSEIPSTLLLINEQFTKNDFSQKIKESSYQIIHLATHGQFSSQAKDTFILSWDDRINIEQLNSLIRADKKEKRPLELLVLSACQTAAGDNRATLGLAGIAVRAGARSTLASLWSVDDEATALLMGHFYQELAKSNNNKNITKAETLRLAQLAILEDQRFAHPYYWSAFVLLGNWL